MNDRRRMRWHEAPLLIALVLLWIFLWGAVTWLNIVTGIVVAVIVMRAFYLPPVELSGRFNPFWFAMFLGRFLGELVIASFQVAFQAFTPRGIEQNAVIAVQLRTRTDFLLTVTAISLSLIPGSLVLEVDRERSILYLHVLGVRDGAAIERTRASVLAVETRLTRAIGSSDDLRRMTE